MIDYPLPSFFYLPLVSPITNQKITEEIHQSFLPGFKKIGGTPLSVEHPEENSIILYFLISGGTEEKVISQVMNRKNGVGNLPVYLITYPGNNSLPSALEALARLQLENINGEIVFLKSPEDTGGFERIRKAVHGMDTALRLRKSRIGIIGNPSEWLVASKTAEPVYEQVWGPKIMSYSLDEVFKSLPEINLPDSPVDLNQENLAGFQTDTGDFKKAHDVFEVVKLVAKNENLDAVTLQCFKLFLNYHTHGCFALSRLNDQGVTAGCEGDLYSTLAMLWIKLFTGQNSWMANPAEPDHEKNTLWLAHCTVPLGMVAEYHEETHFETGCGVAVSGRFENGPVTLIRIGGTNLEKIWLADGEIISSGNSPHRCRTQALVKFSNPASLEELMKKPLGNHLVLTMGHHAGNLLNWWKTYISQEA